MHVMGLKWNEEDLNKPKSCFLFCTIFTLFHRCFLAIIQQYVVCIIFKNIKIICLGTLLGHFGVITVDMVCLEWAK